MYVNTDRYTCDARGNGNSCEKSSVECNLILRYQWTREVENGKEKKSKGGSEDGCKSKETPVGFKSRKYAKETRLMEKDDPTYSRM